MAVAARFPELAELRSELTRVGAELSSLTLSTPDEEAEIGDWRTRIFELSEERDRLQRTLLEGLAQQGVVFAEPSLGGLARALASDAALVSFLRYARDFARDPETGERLEAVDSLLAFVVRPDAAIERVELGPAGPIEDATRVWRASLGRSLGGRGIGVEESPADASSESGEQLRELVLDPVLEQVSDVRTLYVVPDDVLYLVPLDALPLDDDVVGEQVDIHVMPTVLPLIDPALSPEVDSSLLAMGGVDYAADESLEVELASFTATPPLRSGTRAAFEPLPGTLEEVGTVADLFKQTFDDSAVVLRGSDASKAKLVELAPDARFLHIATHGWFVPETEAVSMLDSVSSGDEAVWLALDRAQQTIAGFSPGVLCGIALAGANQGATSMAACRAS